MWWEESKEQRTDKRAVAFCLLDVVWMLHFRTHTSYGHLHTIKTMRPDIPRVLNSHITETSGRRLGSQHLRHHRHGAFWFKTSWIKEKIFNSKTSKHTMVRQCRVSTRDTPFKMKRKRSPRLTLIPHKGRSSWRHGTRNATSSWKQFPKLLS